MKITAVVPWLVKVERTYWGEYLFVEVRTDDGVSGWGEITTTTKVANRAVAAILRQLNELLVGQDPTPIEQLWHRTFRAFTYMGSRGAASHVVSGIDIALWDIVGKVAERADLRTAGRAGARRHPHLHASRPVEVHQQGGRDRGDPHDRRLRPHRDQVRSLSPLRRHFRARARLSRRAAVQEGRTRGGRAHRADPRNGRAGGRNPDRRAWPLRRADRDPALPLAGGRGPDRLVRGAGPGRELSTR